MKGKVILYQGDQPTYLSQEKDHSDPMTLGFSMDSRIISVNDPPEATDAVCEDGSDKEGGISDVPEGILETRRLSVGKVGSYSVALNPESEEPVTTSQGTFENNLHDDFSDFADFESHIANSNASKQQEDQLPDSISLVQEDLDDDEDEDDFGDFHAGGDSVSPEPSAVASSPAISTFAPNNLSWIDTTSAPSMLDCNQILSKAFPEPESMGVISDAEFVSPHLLKNSPLWNRLMADRLALTSLTKVPAWPSQCQAGRRMLQMLSIDSKNIVSHQCATITATSKSLEDRVNRLKSLIPDLDFMRSKTLLFPATSSALGSIGMVLKMAKNMQNSAFRKIDVDKYFEDVDVIDEDGQGDGQTPPVCPEEKEITSLLTQGRQQDALRLLLKGAPLRSRNRSLKDQVVTLMMRVLMSIKSAQVEDTVKGLSSDELDLLMKYIYRGFEAPSDGSSAHLLLWHEKVFERGGLGCISRVLSDKLRP